MALDFTRTMDRADELLRATSAWDLLSPEDEITLAQAIEEGTRAHRRLSDGASTDMQGDAALVSEGTRARDRFICSNIRLVYKHASRFRGATGIDLGDLIHEGVIGLIQAVDRYNWRRGHRFSSYASWWIRVYISRAHAETSKTIKTPLSVHVNIDKARSASERLNQSGARAPSMEEVAEESGLPVAAVTQALNLPRAVPTDIHANGDDAISLLDFVEATGEGSRPDSYAEEAVLRTEVAAAIGHLPADERVAISLRSGLADDREWTFREIAEALDLTPARVRQLCESALDALRQHPQVARLRSF